MALPLHSYYPIPPCCPLFFHPPSVVDQSLQFLIFLHVCLLYKLADTCVLILHHLSHKKSSVLQILFVLCFFHLAVSMFWKSLQISSQRSSSLFRIPVQALHRGGVPQLIQPPSYVWHLECFQHFAVVYSVSVNNICVCSFIWLGACLPYRLLEEELLG